MRLMSKTTGIFVLAIGLGALVFQTSQNVQDLEGELHSLERAIEHEQEKTTVLEVEWEYLNRPQRLEDLARKRLKMQMPSPDGMVGAVDDVPALNIRPQGEAVVPPYKPASMRQGSGRQGGEL